MVESAAVVSYFVVRPEFSRLSPPPAGLIVGVRGSSGQALSVVAIDPAGVTRIVNVVLPASGVADVAL